MTKIKMCGLSKISDIETANIVMPEYVGFVFAKKSKRYVSYSQAKKLKQQLNPKIKAVGVYVNENLDMVIEALDNGIIDVIQLHGSEDDEYINRLRDYTDKPIIKAFIVNKQDDIIKAEQSAADYVLLDGGKGDGKTFDWDLLAEIKRPFFLAGGLSTENVSEAVRMLNPYAVDVSSGIEINGKKDSKKMAAFAAKVRKENNYD